MKGAGGRRPGRPGPPGPFESREGCRGPGRPPARAGLSSRVWRPPFRRASEPEQVSGPGPAGRGTCVLGPGGLRPPAIAGELSAGAGLAGLPSQQSRRPADLASPAAALGPPSEVLVQ